MRRISAADVVDVFAYTVVLGVFVQLFPAVITESFLVTLLTAVLLKLVLELVVALKTWALGRFRLATTPGERVLRAAVLLVVLPGSKFLVLEATDLVFGDAVHLGGFFQVTVLIVALMLARGGARLLLREGRADGPVRPVESDRPDAA
ncbi:hypothetical protein ROT00_00800 [Agromyces mediolanus]|uniref:hypothetical protein n=1 Tax=Agromyces mediolanus TaxID=41986 RepID=UPI0038395450